jgi:hypothetical protein
MVSKLSYRIFGGSRISGVGGLWYFKRIQPWTQIFYILLTNSMKIAVSKPPCKISPLPTLQEDLLTHLESMVGWGYAQLGRPPGVRNCWIKTTPYEEKKDLLGARPQSCPLGSGSSSLAGMGSGLYRRGQAMGEGENLWSPIICDHQMEQVDMPN